MVLNVRVQVQPNTTSVKAVWDKIDVPGISSYTVYYSTEGESEEFVTAPSSDNSVMIMDLRSGAKYEFQVIAIGTVNRQEISGERSAITNQSAILVPEICKGLSLIATLIIPLLKILLYRLYQKREYRSTFSRNISTTCCCNRHSSPVVWLGHRLFTYWIHVAFQEKVSLYSAS